MTKDLIEALKAIAALNPSDDSEEGFNEWGEADCFRQAQTIARAALALNQAPAESPANAPGGETPSQEAREAAGNTSRPTGVVVKADRYEVSMGGGERYTLWHGNVMKSAQPAPVAQPAAGVAEFVAKFEACKREAQQWKQEAKTANATIAEIYQLCTGKTGEPGNWNGAKPVRELIESLCAPTPEVKPEAALSDEQISNICADINLDYEDEDFSTILKLARAIQAAIAAKGKTT